MDYLVRSTIAFVHDHQAWGVPIVFILAFCESFAFVSLVVPTTGILLGVGGLIAAAELGFWPMWLAAAVGAIVGDWVAYWLAFHFKDRVLQMWPLAGHPDWVARGAAFFKKWGMLAVFIGRFFGPLRAVVPLIAGLNAMPWLNFQIANVASAALWAARSSRTKWVSASAPGDATMAATSIASHRTPAPRSTRRVTIRTPSWAAQRWPSSPSTVSK